MGEILSAVAAALLGIVCLRRAHGATDAAPWMPVAGAFFFIFSAVCVTHLLRRLGVGGRPLRAVQIVLYLAVMALLMAALATTLTS